MKTKITYLLIFSTIVVYSCNTSNEKKVSGPTQNELNDSIPKIDTSSDSENEELPTLPHNLFFSDLFQQITKVRARTSGNWRYNASTFRCRESDNVKCYEFSYHSYVPDCFDIIGKPCLEKLLVVKVERNKQDNPNLDQIVDRTETITSFQLFAENESIKNSWVIGKHIEEIKSVFGDATNKEKDKLTYQLLEGKFELTIVSDTLKSISFQK